MDKIVIRAACEADMFEVARIARHYILNTVGQIKATGERGTDVPAINCLGPHFPRGRPAP